MLHSCVDWSHFLETGYRIPLTLSLWFINCGYIVSSERFVRFFLRPTILLHNHTITQLPRNNPVRWWKNQQTYSHSYTSKTQTMYILHRVHNVWCASFGVDVLIHMDGLVQDCSYFTALAMQLLQSRTKPPILYFAHIHPGCPTSTKAISWFSLCHWGNLGDIIRMGPCRITEKTQRTTSSVHFYLNVVYINQPSMYIMLTLEPYQIPRTKWISYAMYIADIL